MGNSWRDKANRVIQKLCNESRLQAHGKRKRHVPYSVPMVAQELIECLSSDDEVRAKSIFVSYDGMQAVK